MSYFVHIGQTATNTRLVDIEADGDAGLVVGFLLHERDDEGAVAALAVDGVRLLQLDVELRVPPVETCTPAAAQ